MAWCAPCHHAPGVRVAARTLASLVHLVDLYHNYSTIFELVRSGTCHVTSDT